jgi:predicted transcriptional regulator
MSGNDILQLISDFVERARLADDQVKVRRCVDEGLANLQSADISHDDAIHMLTTAVISRSEQDEAASPNLFQVFVELDRRKTPTAVDILPLLTSAGSLPLAELTMRSRASPEPLLQELKSLVGQGLIEVEGGMPNKAGDLRTDRRRVRLTIRGTRRAFR